MRKVQAVVRSVQSLVWKRGFSRCYRDKTSTGIRFKFDYINTNPLVKESDPNIEEVLNSIADDVRKALAEEGYEGFEVNISSWTWGVDPYLHPVVVVHMPASQF